MTRIYSNVPAMIARSSLNANLSTLQTSLERLSTGFKINSGKDDPAGLIASEILRSDITGIKTAIKNTERANSMIATADSAMNEITSLLNDIRGLVTEAANTGAMSAEMIAANQLQVDASLDAIDRIASQTTFMGQKLLDGSLGFDLSGVNRNDVKNLTVNQAIFPSDKSPINVSVTVQEAASQAELYYNNPAVAENIILQWGGNEGYATETFQRGATVSDIAAAINASSNSTGVQAEVGSDAIAGTIITSSLGANNDIIITAGATGTAASNIEIKYLKGTSDGIVVKYEEPTEEGGVGKLLVYLQTEAYEAAMADNVDTSAGINDNNALQFTANIEGAQYNNADIQYVDGKATQLDWDTKSAESNVKGAYAEYSDVATSATALFGDVNGLGTLSNTLGTNEYLQLKANAAGSDLNNVSINIINNATEIPAGREAYARYSVDDNGNKSLNVYVNADTTTLQDIQNALTLEGTFSLSTNADLTTVVDAADFTGLNPVQGNTQNSGGDAGTIFIYLDKDLEGTANAYTANDIVSLFDLTSDTSRGSERAASLFDVQRTADNSGTGTIHLYENYTDANGNPVAPTTAFKNVFTGGVSGGDVVTTAAELVTALNNSAYWGMEMCPEMLAELAAYNASGTYFDASDPPVITARLAPGNNGLFTVSAFEEVAYYGDPNEGTGLQFLGEANSPDIRFVAEPGNSEIWVEQTTVPDTVDFSSAVLTATNPNASLVIQANKKGEEYDDVQIVFKRINEDPTAVPDTDPNRAESWVEYDPGTSYAEAQVLFKNTDGTDVANSAFYVTATERGDMYNNVSVMMTRNDSQIEPPVVVSFDETTNQLRVSISNGYLNTVTTNDVIAAINAADVPFQANLSFSQEADNDGSGTFENLGLKNKLYSEIGSTGETGGHTGGTVTVWLTDVENADGTTREMTTNEIANLINADQVVGQMFIARTYSTGSDSGTGSLDLTKDGPIVTSGGLVERGVLTVHLATDENGLVTTTAKDLADWWDQQDPETVANISVSLVRPPGAVWDECNDPYGWGLLAPTVGIGDCDELIVNDIKFVGWDDDGESQSYVATKASGTMTSDNGENSSYDLIAKRVGPDYNGYTIVYVNDNSITGSFSDNTIAEASTNPCDDDTYSGLPTNDCGEVITPSSYSNNGLFLELDSAAKTITVHVREGVTTASDIEQLIESDPFTKNLFEIQQKGDGSGLITLQDNTLLTEGGALPPGELNGAKLLFGSEASDYYLVVKSTEYGSEQFVNVIATAADGGSTSFQMYTADGKAAEKDYGDDVVALVNGVKAVGNGLSASLNTTNLSLDFTLSEAAATNTNYSTNFSITGGGATYQIGPDVVSNQQITLGIPSMNTVQLGGVSGKLYQLRSGQDASLTTDTNLAFRIVEEAIVSVTQVRGRLGTIQKATFDTNINVLNDTLEALTEAESMIRDTDFAEETANLTRAQILVQSSLSSLGIANQIPNYMLSLLGG